jgi:4a-hydroxytetrahydrobiopterin dehydratase
MDTTCALKDSTCKPCEGGVPPLTKSQIEELLPQISRWSVVEDKQIQKDFKYKNFKQALEFVNKVGEIAEQQGHHPNIFLHNWNKVRISLSTHAIKGLSDNDFILAAKIDTIVL